MRKNSALNVPYWVPTRKKELNPGSLRIITDARLEPALAAATPGVPVQFERQGYFARDPKADADRLVFNRTVGLRDTWAKVKGAGG